MSSSQKSKAPAAPTLLGHPPVRTFTTLYGLYYAFYFGGRERTCHETNSLLRWRAS